MVSTIAPEEMSVSCFRPSVATKATCSMSNDLDEIVKSKRTRAQNVCGDFADQMTCADLSGDSSTEGPSGSDTELSTADLPPSSTSGVSSDEESVTSTRSSCVSVASGSEVATVYTITILLRLRASLGLCRAASRLGYGTQPRAKFDDSTGVQPQRNRTNQENSHQVGIAKAIAPSANSWAAQQQLRRSGRNSADDLECEEFARAARSILNKLTIERFEPLYEKLASLDIRSSQHIAVLMREIFEKATTQHNFIAMYADVCKRLESDPRIARVATSPSYERDGDFRRILLNQCQRSFEEMLEGRRNDTANTCDADAEEARTRCKQRVLGSIKLTGELLVRGMLSWKLLIRCSEELIAAKEVCSEALEALVALLMVTGPVFERASNGSTVEPFEAIFVKVKGLAGSRDVSPRVRFLLRDLLELRSAGWVDKREATHQKPAPMRLEEIQNTQAMTLGGGRPVNDTQGVKGSLATERNERRLSMLQARMEEPSPNSARGTPKGAASQRKTDLESGSGSHPAAANAARRRRKVRTVPEPQKPAEATVTAGRKSWQVAKSVQVKSSQSVTSEAVQPSQETVAPVMITASGDFDCSAFRREAWSILRELFMTQRINVAARRIRECHVPAAHQAQEFADMITKVAEEPRGPARRCAFACVASLVGAAEAGGFGRAQCLEGVSIFFQEIYNDLAEEVPMLNRVVRNELLPVLREALPKDLNSAVPAAMLSAS